MAEPTDPTIAADLTAYAMMRALLRTPDVGVAIVRSDLAEILDDLEDRYGRDAVITLIASLGVKALSPIEAHAEHVGTSTAAELDADEHQALILLERQRYDSEPPRDP